MRSGPSSRRFSAATMDFRGPELACRTRWCGFVEFRISNGTVFSPYIYIYTYIHMYIHTYAYIYIYIYVCVLLLLSCSADLSGDRSETLERSWRGNPLWGRGTAARSKTLSFCRGTQSRVMSWEVGSSGGAARGDDPDHAVSFRFQRIQYCILQSIEKQMAIPPFPTSSSAHLLSPIVLAITITLSYHIISYSIVLHCMSTRITPLPLFCVNFYSMAPFISHLTHCLRLVVLLSLLSGGAYHPAMHSITCYDSVLHYRCARCPALARHRPFLIHTHTHVQHMGAQTSA